MQNSSHQIIKGAGVAALLALSTSEGYGEIYYPKRGIFDASTGYMETYVDGGWYRGSGVIARDSRLIYSCGHLLYEDGIWATDYFFYRAYHNYTFPEESEGNSPRGFHYFTNYSDNVDYYGANSRRSFAYDFTVYYGNDSFGEALGWWQDGAAALKSSRAKRIVGYPSKIDYTRASGYYYQHGTDWFTNRAWQDFGAYYGLDNVTTGSGNSGGPVFVADSSNYYLAGILVAGSSDSAGVYALNASSNSMASAALGLKSITRTFSNTSSSLLADGASSYTVKKTTASGFSDTVTALKFSMTLTTPRRGDLDVYLQSPSGRIRWINKQSTSTADNIVISGADYSAKFNGYAANGVWQLKMRDAVTKNRATFSKFSVTVSALGE
jgi:hypothetical protein